MTSDPVLKFFVVAITFYGMATFEGPMLSVKTVNMLSHYTDWNIAHVHGGALGWNGFMIFGMIYWLAPRLFQTKLHSRKLAEWHFWIGTIGILLYVIPIYVAGLRQGLMWRAFDTTGNLQFPDFIETVVGLMPLYTIRVLGGTLYLTGALMLAYNVVRTWMARPSTYDRPVQLAPALTPMHDEARPEFKSRLTANTEMGHRGDMWLQALLRRVVAPPVGADAVEVHRVGADRGGVGVAAGDHPAVHDPVERAVDRQRDAVHAAGACGARHLCLGGVLQLPLADDPSDLGGDEALRRILEAGEFVYDHPFQWGSRRIGPDLAREGGLRSNLWHVLHLQDPRQSTQQSIMPAYPHLLTDPINFKEIQRHVRAQAMIGVPYGDMVKEGAAAEHARAQAKTIADDIARSDGPKGLEDRRIVALVAYLQRLGADISRPPPVADAPAPTSTSPAPTPAAAPPRCCRTQVDRKDP